MTTPIIIALLVTIVVILGWKLFQVQRPDAPSPDPRPVSAAAAGARPTLPADADDLTLRELVARDDLLGAVKRVMRERQLDMEQAHAVVESLRAQRPLPGASRRLSGDRVAASTEFQGLIAANQRMEAIKYYRAATGCGLKEAKEAMEKAVADRRK